MFNDESINRAHLAFYYLVIKVFSIRVVEKVSIGS